VHESFDRKWRAAVLTVALLLCAVLNCGCIVMLSSDVESLIEPTDGAETLLTFTNFLQWVILIATVLSLLLVGVILFGYHATKLPAVFTSFRQKKNE